MNCNHLGPGSKPCICLFSTGLYLGVSLKRNVAAIGLPTNRPRHTGVCCFIKATKAPVVIMVVRNIVVNGGPIITG